MLGYRQSVLMGPAGLSFGGGGLPPSPDAFTAPVGIPDPRNATAGDPAEALGINIAELLSSGQLSAEELLQIVAALAGVGGDVPGGGGGPQAPPGGPIQQAFAGGGLPGGGGQPPLPQLPL